MRYEVEDLATGCEASAYLAHHESAGDVVRIVVETSPLMGVLDLTPGAWAELKDGVDRLIGKIGEGESAEQPVTGEKR